MYLEHQKHKEPSHGKIPVKKLVGQGAGAKSIEVTDNNIKAFERVARKYNVDFAVKRDKCIFRKNRALAPHERSAVPLGTDHCPVG